VPALSTTGLPNAFELFETIHATQSAGCRHLNRHLHRLQSSAAYFGFAYDEIQLRKTLDDTCAALPAGVAHRVRLSLNQTGGFHIQAEPILPLLEPVRVFISAEKINADDLFLRHKTTVRERYDLAWRTAESHGAFDTLFCNTRGELTEGGRSNIFVQLDGNWYTPPLNAGVLPGVMRAVLLDDPAWNARERRLTPDDVAHAEKLVVCNALRGVLIAVVVGE
jgi:para-aminobenzoate synthetase/4-amino-4-deoxychorismate lyase